MAKCTPENSRPGTGRSLQAKESEMPSECQRLSHRVDPFENWREKEGRGQSVLHTSVSWRHRPE